MIEPSKTNDSFQWGFKVLLLTPLSSLCFLSGSSMIFTYGSLVPEKSFAGRSAARMIVTARVVRRKSYLSRNCIRPKLSSALFEPACLTEQSSKSPWVGRDCSANNSFDVVVDVDVFGVSLKPDTFCQILISILDCYHFLLLWCETAILLSFA